MIAPRTPLLIWTAALAVPAAGWLVFAPGWLPVLLLAVWAAVGAWDARQSRRLLAGVRLDTPGVIRLARGRPATLDLTVSISGRPPPRGLELTLSAPPEICLHDVTLNLVFHPPGTAPAKKGKNAPNPPAARRRAYPACWHCTPRERGHYRLSRCHARTASRWGFWHLRAVLPLEPEIRVYPGLMSDRRHAPALFLRRGMSGIRQQRLVGKGREFEQLRDYQPGDSLEDIHWKATARHGYPVTKIFQVERTQEVYLVIDASRLSARQLAPSTAAPDREGGPPPTEPLLESFVNTALLLGRTAEMQGDRFGLLTFSDRLHGFVRARRGHGHYRTCLDAVCRLRSQPVSPDFSEVFACIRRRLRRRALIVLLTQLDDPVLAETLLHDINCIRRQHLLLVCLPTPATVQPIFSDPAAVQEPDDLYAALCGHLRWIQLRNLCDAFRRQGVHFLLTPDNRLLPELITRYLNIKQRQIL